MVGYITSILPDSWFASNNILNGDTGPKRDIVVLNAAHAFVVAEKAHDVAQGIDLAEQILDKGVAQDKLNELVAFTKSQ